MNNNVFQTTTPAVEWKPIPLKGLTHYEVSNTGLIRTVSKHALVPLHYKDHFMSFIPKSGKFYNKYIRVQRMVALAFLPPPTNSQVYYDLEQVDGINRFVWNRDLDRRNCHVSNLFWSSSIVRAVICKDYMTDVIHEFQNIIEAAKVLDLEDCRFDLFVRKAQKNKAAFQLFGRFAMKLHSDKSTWPYYDRIEVMAAVDKLKALKQQVKLKAMEKAGIPAPAIESKNAMPQYKPKVFVYQPGQPQTQWRFPEGTTPSHIAATLR